MPSIRTLLIVARAYSLPTIWSNCLAAWWLGGGGGLWGLATLLVGASLLHSGGQFMSDAADAEYDRQFRRERPVPSGRITEKIVWRSSYVLLVSGTLMLLLLGAFCTSSLPVTGSNPETPVAPLQASKSATANPESGFHSDEATGRSSSPAKPSGRESEEPAWMSRKPSDTRTESLPSHWLRPQGIKHPLATVFLVLALTTLVLVHALIHKAITFWPVLAGAYRCLLYLVAASCAKEGMTGTTVWCGLAMGCYVTGFSYYARLNRMLRHPEWWPCALLAAPLILAFVLNQGPYQKDSLLLSVILGLWIIRSLRPALGSSQQNLPRAVEALLAGIVLVDLLAVCSAPKEFSFLLLLLFGITLLSQRLLPSA